MVRISNLLRGPVGAALRWAFSLGLLVWLVWRVDWSRAAGLQGLDWRFAVPAVLLAGAAYPLQAWRWQVLLHAQGIVRPVRWVHGVFWIGQFYNSFLPGGVAGDVVRLTRLWQVEPARRAGGIASLLADRLFGLGALLVLASLALGMHLACVGRATSLLLLLIVSVAASVVIVIVGWSLVGTRWWEPLSARVLGDQRAAALHDATVALGTRRGALGWAACLSVAVWLADFLSLWLLARSVGLGTGPLEISVAAAAAYVAAALPLSIGGHGVREVSLVGVLALIGHGAGGAGTSSLLALAFWALSMAWCLVGGVVQLLSVCTGWPVERYRPDPAG
jgi:uncharacterized protein (TIRG00374 family)